MGVGRPKLEISKFQQLNIRVTEEKFAEIERRCEKIKNFKDCGSFESCQRISTDYNSLAVAGLCS